MLFLWQLPHFFSIAWIYREDYRRGGYRMLSVVDAGGRITSLQVALLSALLVPVTLLPTPLGITGRTVGLIRATKAERVSSEEAAKAKAINAFLQEVLGSGNPREGLGLEATIIEALDSSMERIDDSFNEQPEIVGGHQ